MAAADDLAGLVDGVLSTGLAVAAVVLAGRIGESPAELVFNHHAIGIVTSQGGVAVGITGRRAWSRQDAG